ncbi:predicted protein [Botrytis cinerea T4]|uniref:Uncharacterized protein n=1 Tax=Botryotinia fuckeliana (strain T4) TaxID=999810 RepID=G2YY49_BOTF4|nr:predicted protein [Botrytis cinerea T4]
MHVEDRQVSKNLARALAVGTWMGVVLLEKLEFIMSI